MCVCACVCVKTVSGHGEAVDMTVAAMKRAGAKRAAVSELPP